MAGDKASPRLYAQTVPRLRYMLTKLTKEDKVRDVISQPSLEEAAGLLRDTLYGDSIEPGPAWRLQVRILEAHLRLVQRIARTTPPPAQPLALAFQREIEARDAFTAASMIAGGSLELEMLPSARVEGTILYTVRGEQELLSTPARFLEHLRGTWLAPYVDIARSLEGEAGARAYQLAASAAAIGVYSDPLQGLEARLARRVASAALCPILKWRAASILLEARLAGLQSRSVEVLIPPVPACDIKPARLRAIYEREPTVEGLQGSLRDTLGVRLDPQKPAREALEEARAHARREARRRALQAFSGYPFHAGLIAAALLLARLEAEDLATILTGIQLRMPPEEYLPSTTYSITV